MIIISFKKYCFVLAEIIFNLDYCLFVYALVRRFSIWITVCSSHILLIQRT